MSEELIFREATNNDTGAIKTMIFSVLEEYGLPPDPCRTDADLEDIETSYTNNNGYFIVVTNAGRVIATMGILRIDTGTCELRKMYAIPAARGRGLGKTLMELALAKAVELGYRRMVLETASPLKEAIGLYRRYGFRQYQPACIAERCDQAYELMLDQFRDNDHVH